MSDPQKTRLCPHCKMEINALASKCPHCQSKVETPSQKKFKYIVAGAFFFIVMFIIISATTSPTTPSVNTSLSQTGLSIGQDGYIKVSTAKIVVGIDKATEDEIVSSSIAGDTTGVALLVLDGKAFFVENGTKVKVIDKTMASVRIRILDGEEAGNSGWVPFEFVSTNP